MKRAGNLIPLIADPDNLRLAAWKAAKGKRHSHEVLHWTQSLDKNLAELRNQVLSGRVNVGNYRYFKVYEPKERQICASAFGEQVLHHALMNICHPYFEKKQIFDSYASRKGKGVHAALERAKNNTRKFEWYLKLDVRKFFESISHEHLLTQLNGMFKDACLLDIFSQIIESYASSPGKGLPIGNLTSQYFANHYLSSLDHYTKEQLKTPAYVRYMDDMVLWHSDKDFLKMALGAIQNYVNGMLSCDLKTPALNQTRTGLPFLGYHIFPYHTQLLHKSKHRFLRKLKTIENALESEAWNEPKCFRKAAPLIAFINHADSASFRKHALTN